MTSIHGRSGIRRLAAGLVVTLLAFAGAVIGAAPAYAAPDVVETTLSVSVDPEVPSSAVLHGEMIGSYVEAGGTIPAGTWSFLVADDTGATLFTKDIAQPAGGPTSVDVVWADVPAGVWASGILTFAPAEPSDQVEFAGATASFSTDGVSANESEISRTTETPATTESATSAPETADPLSLALSVLVLVSLLIAALGILFLVRRDRRSAGGRT